MKRRTRGKVRSGVTLVETAIVLPVTLFLIFALMIGALGVFRYQEVSALARQASRYASTHGAQYRKDAGLPRGTSSDWQADTYTNSVQPGMALLDPSLLTTRVSWPDVSNQPGSP